ncbi:MAG: hypothetical protein WA638_00875, partial [Candidatus Acidiferrales bacterium]
IESAKRHAEALAEQDRRSDEHFARWEERKREIARENRHRDEEVRRKEEIERLQMLATIPQEEDLDADLDSNLLFDYKQQIEEEARRAPRPVRFWRRK